jgi:hypothetical protein
MTASADPSRRTFLLGAASLAGIALSGCSSMSIGSRRIDLPDLGNLMPPQFSPYVCMRRWKIPVLVV